MKTFLVKQKFRLEANASLSRMTGEKLPIRWRIIFKIPKTFTIYDAAGEQVSQISKEILTLLPRFEIQLRDGSSFVIRKKLTFGEISMSLII